MNISYCYKRCPCIFSAVFFTGSFGIDIGKADVKTTVRRTNTSKWRRKLLSETNELLTQKPKHGKYVLNVDTIRERHIRDNYDNTFVFLKPCWKSPQKSYEGEFLKHASNVGTCSQNFLSNLVNLYANTF